MRFLTLLLGVWIVASVTACGNIQMIGKWRVDHSNAVTNLNGSTQEQMIFFDDGTMVVLLNGDTAEPGHMPYVIRNDSLFVKGRRIFTDGEERVWFKYSICKKEDTLLLTSPGDTIGLEPNH